MIISRVPGCELSAPPVAGVPVTIDPAFDLSLCWRPGGVISVVRTAKAVVHRRVG